MTTAVAGCGLHRARAAAYSRRLADPRGGPKRRFYTFAKPPPSRAVFPYQTPLSPGPGRARPHPCPKSPTCQAPSHSSCATWLCPPTQVAEWGPDPGPAHVVEPSCSLIASFGFCAQRLSV
ncbi:hypothetical protein TCAP_07577 [Tolypocladium capitatum]|uniref:Uncharacterized protein n=1 Tax=Tolypocladium capitatum TaxID=45235 RepID=A0A2K3PSN1_9HYPO|nr:hypothetical protein TCAP_07577 [Tolypocladium capitatum]